MKSGGLHAVLDRATSPSSDSLAQAADYTQLLGAVGGLHAGGSTWIVRVAPMANMVSGVLGMAMLGSGADDPEKADRIAKIAAVVQGLGLDGVRWIGGTDWREPSGRVKGTAIVSINPGAQGLLPRCLASTGTIDRKLVEHVPGDSLSMSAGSIDWLPAVYDFGMSTFKALDPAAYEEAQTSIKGFMGESDLRADLLANLHGTLLTYGVPGAGFPEQSDTHSSSSVLRGHVRGRRPVTNRRRRRSKRNASKNPPLAGNHRNRTPANRRSASTLSANGESSEPHKTQRSSGAATRSGVALPFLNSAVAGARRSKG